jgi:S1-C subfamily serine protease
MKMELFTPTITAVILFGLYCISMIALVVSDSGRWKSTAAYVYGISGALAVLTMLFWWLNASLHINTIESNHLAVGTMRSSGGIASGVLVRDQITIVTARHVVDAFPEYPLVSIDIADDLISGKVIYRSDINDIAVVELSRPVQDVIPATANCVDRELYIGLPIYNIGNIGGFDRPVIFGTISLPYIFKSWFSSHIMDDPSHDGMYLINTFVRQGASGGAVFNSNTNQIIGIIGSLIKDLKQEYDPYDIALVVKPSVICDALNQPKQDIK